MAGHAGERRLCFEKILTDSDNRFGLEIPQSAVNLPEGDEVMRVRDQNERDWMFKASTRKTGRRYMSNDWLAFARASFARPGDKLTYYHLVNENVYVVRVQSPAYIRLFGQDMRGYPDH